MNGKLKKTIGFILTLAFLAVISANLSMVAAAKAEAADDAECKAAIAIIGLRSMMEIGSLGSRPLLRQPVMMRRSWSQGRRITATISVFSP